jgi:predicted Zn-dependent protease
MDKMSFFLKNIVCLLLVIISQTLLSQNEFTFGEQLKVICKEKINSEIKPGMELTVLGLKYEENNGYPITTVVANDENGVSTNFDYKKLDSFEFKEIDNINKSWDKSLLKNGTFQNLFLNGFQFKLRRTMNEDAESFINALSDNDKFYNDSYVEDYIYTLINKIYSGQLTDSRPGSVFIKILKDAAPNAYTLPNGCIIISTGLLSTVQSEDELVGVLAHEIAHFILDHHIINYNKELERQKRAEFWSTFSVLIAATADVYLASNNDNHLPGVLTVATASIALAISNEVLTQLGISYTKEQEKEADKVAHELLNILNYNTFGLSTALKRIKTYCLINGNYLALSGGSTHPSLDERISALGWQENYTSSTSFSYQKKTASINSYNAWQELWAFSHHETAAELAGRNIANGVAIEYDYITLAVVTRRLTNTKESNENAINLLKKAKDLNVTPPAFLDRELGISYLRLDKKAEAKIAFQNYLSSVIKIKEDNGIKEITNSNAEIEYEIFWTRNIIFRLDNF